MKLFLTIQSARTRKAKLATQRMYTPCAQCMDCGRSEWYNSKCYGGSKEQCEKVCNALDGGVLECKAGCLYHCLLSEDEQNAVVQESRNPSKQPVGRDTNSGKYDPDLYIGSCYIGKCAPGGSRPDSCGPESEFVQSKYCQESQANCESRCGNQALNEPAVWDDRKCLGGSYSSCSAVCPYAHRTFFGRGICRLLCGVHCVFKELKESDIMTVEDGHNVLKADIVASL